jgi:hypothetical protein
MGLNVKTSRIVDIINPLTPHESPWCSFPVSVPTLDYLVDELMICVDIFLVMVHMKHLTLVILPLLICCQESCRVHAPVALAPVGSIPVNISNKIHSR